MHIKVTIADDHPLAINGVKNMLEPFKHIEVISSYTTGFALMDGLKVQQPDVLLLDILLPDTTGKELASAITAQYPGIRIIALTSLDAPTHVKSMMRRGCLGYLLKNTDHITLLTAIEHVYKGVEYIAPALKEQMLSNILKGKKIHNAANAPILTHREKEILDLIVAEYTNQEIADKLFLSLRTVEGHRLNLLQKFDVKNIVGLVKIALQMGSISN